MPSHPPPPADPDRLEPGSAAVPRHSRAIAAVLGTLLATACGSVPTRHPLPQNLADSAVVLGRPNLRMWGDRGMAVVERLEGSTEEELRSQFAASFDTEHDYLVISGGGENGAFGAGLLCGWTERGNRPEFTLVTGISTGALSAPFAFLGPRYDAQLREVYTIYHTSDLVEERGWFGLIGSDSLTSTAPLARMIEKYMTAEMLAEIAVEHRRGRRLYVATTNLDAGRPVIWNIGEIAISGHPDALALFHQVLLASSAIPVAFPPVYLDVEADGESYDELHVDGGATAQLFLFPLGLDWSRVRKVLRVHGAPKAYVIRNAKLTPTWATVDPGLLTIASRTMSSMIRTQGIGDLYRTYLQCQRDGIEMHLANIPDDFEHEMVEMFDPAYMQALFELGHELGKQDFAWQTSPPDVELPRN